VEADTERALTEIERGLRAALDGLAALRAGRMEAQRVENHAATPIDDEELAHLEDDLPDGPMPLPPRPAKRRRKRNVELEAKKLIAEKLLDAAEEFPEPQVLTPAQELARVKLEARRRAKPAPAPTVTRKGGGGVVSCWGQKSKVLTELKE
jgi:hypothetical protein